MKIKTRNGEYPLTELVDYTMERGPVSIQRFNASKEVRIESDLFDPYASVPPIIAKVETDVISEMQKLYPGVEVLYQGQSRSSGESVQQIQSMFGLAFALIIILLSIHFRSLSHAAIILMMIPLSFLGAAWGHGLHGQPISILSVWGMVALSGVIVNDAVVFLAKFNSNLLEGMKIEDAVYHAGLARFRAILLTTITTTVGLYPIILETSFQAQFLVPMAISLAYGVAVGTGFILSFFPALILVLNDLKLVFSKYILRKDGLLPEDIEPAMVNSKIKID